MDDFLGNLASKSLGLAPILQPKPMSRFEPWPTNGVLEPVHSSFDAPLATERATTRVEAGVLMLPRENDAPVQARPDPLHYEPRHHDDEVSPRAPTLRSFPPSEPKPAATQQAALAPTPILAQPTPRARAVSDGTAAPAGVDQSSATRDGRVAIGPREPPLAERIVEPKHAAREHEMAPVAVKPTGLVPPPLVSAPVIEAQPFAERTERGIVEHEPTARENEVAPVAERISAQLSMPGAAPRPVRTPRQVEDSGVPNLFGPFAGQRAVVERERADQDHAEQPSPARSPAAALPASITVDASSAVHPIVTPIIERMERVREQPDGGEDARSGSIRTSQQLIEAPRSASEPQLSAPPTIHVTIGRIEVRATPPGSAPPVRRTAPVTTTTSLEEYLRSQAGNRR